MDTFRLKMLPALDGDCLLLSWGDGGPLHHMVIDGGRKSAYRHLSRELATIAAAGEKLSLYVLTHVDADHIEGSLAYLDDRTPPLLPNDVWFNGFVDEPPPPPPGGLQTRSMAQGDRWSNAIARHGLRLNDHFSNGLASIEGAPDPFFIEGLKITMLSPDAAHWKRMLDIWEKYRLELRNAEGGMRGPAARRVPAPIPHPIVLDDLLGAEVIDPEIPNGSSIAFLAEWKGRRVLLGGDAHPDLLATSLQPLAAAEDGRYRVDLLKASHHGSTKSTSTGMIECLACRQLAISTNGNLHQHPDPGSIARFLKYAPAGRKDIWFNYDTDRTRPWDEPVAMKEHGYHVHYPAAGTPGMIEINLMTDFAP